MGIGLAGSEVLEAELCQSLPLFVAHVAIGAPVGERAVNADGPFASRELPEEGAHEPVPQPRERRPDGGACEHDRGEGHVERGVAPRSRSPSR